MQHATRVRANGHHKDCFHRIDIRTWLNLERIALLAGTMTLRRTRGAASTPRPMETGLGNAARS